MLEIGRRTTVQHMASHVSHVGVHDHGFNNVSTYGNLCAWRARAASTQRVGDGVLRARAQGVRRRAGRALDRPAGRAAATSTRSTARTRSSPTRCGRCDRSPLAHQLGHALMGERDRKISLLHRLVQHADTNAAYNVYFGKGRDAYDVRGRVAHESVFNLNDGSYRCPSSQQGYSPFSHVDARPCLGDARLRRGTRVPRDARRRGVRGVRRTRSERCCGATSKPHARPRLLPRAHADVRRAVLGHRRSGARASRRLSRATGRSVQRPRARRQLRRRHRRAGPDPSRHATSPATATRPPASATWRPA